MEELKSVADMVLTDQDRPGWPGRSRKQTQLLGVTKGLRHDRVTFFPTVPKSLHVSWHCGTWQDQPTQDKADTWPHLTGNKEADMSWVPRRHQATCCPLSAPRDAGISWWSLNVRNPKPPEDVNIHNTNEDLSRSPYQTMGGQEGKQRGGGSHAFPKPVLCGSAPSI